MSIRRCVIRLVEITYIKCDKFELHWSKMKMGCKRLIDTNAASHDLVVLHAVIDSNSYQQLMNKTDLMILVFLSLQVLLGILKVVWVLPLGIAVTHNAVAALLLLTIITLNYIIYAQPTSQFN